MPPHSWQQLNMPALLLGGKHPLVQPGQPVWAVVREIAAAKAGCFCCHRSGGGWFFLDSTPPDCEGGVVVVSCSFFVGISKYKTITKINKKIKKARLAVTCDGVQHTSVTWLRYNKMKNVASRHTFLGNLTTNPFCCIMTMSLCHHFQLRHQTVFNKEKYS